MARLGLKQLYQQFQLSATVTVAVAWQAGEAQLCINKLLFEKWGVQKIVPAARIVRAAELGKFLKFSIQNGTFSAIFGNENGLKWLKMHYSTQKISKNYTMPA